MISPRHNIAPACNAVHSTAGRSRQPWTREHVSRRSSWTKAEIRAARRVALAPLLLKRGLALHDRGGGNLELEAHKGVILKDWYWNWPERDMSGNTIDFYVDVLGASFNDAMREILK